MKKRFDISKCLPFDTLLIILLVLVSIVYLTNFMNNKYVDDKYKHVEEKEKTKLNNKTKDTVENFYNSSGSGLTDTELEHQRIIDLITTALSSYQTAKVEYDENQSDYNQATILHNEAIANGGDQATLTELSDQKNNLSAKVYVSTRNLNDTKDRLLNMENQYPEEYSLVVYGSVAESLENDEDEPQLQQPVVHNHYNQYYGGNPEMTKFLQQLTNQLTENKQEGDLSLMDQGMCSELNNKLSTMSLAEFKNNRFVQDLKSRCENSQGVDCSFRPINSQTALLGTLLDDAKQTQVGSILPKEEISTNY
jgi:hypothetical protein